MGPGDGHAHREMGVEGSAEEGRDRAVTRHLHYTGKGLCGRGSPVPGLQSSGWRAGMPPHPVAGSDCGMLGEPGGQVCFDV